MILPNEVKELIIQWVSIFSIATLLSLLFKCVSCLAVIFNHEKDLLLQLMSILLIYLLIGACLLLIFECVSAL